MACQARNVLAKIPTDHRPTIKGEVWAIFDDIDADPGQAAVDEAQRRIDGFADRPAPRFLLRCAASKTTVKR